MQTDKPENCNDWIKESKLMNLRNEWMKISALFPLLAQSIRTISNNKDIIVNTFVKSRSLNLIIIIIANDNNKLS